VTGGDAAPAEEPATDLAQELERLGYLELFLRPDDAAVERVWRRPGARGALRRLAVDPASRPLAAFLAAEVLHARDDTFPAPADRDAVAGAYAGALRGDLTGMANPWGLPGELDGPLAVHVLALGEAAVPALAGLLDDDTELVYGGSEEATVGNDVGFRVRDMAASLLAALLGVDAEVSQDLRGRDVTVDRVRQRLSSGQPSGTSQGRSEGRPEDR
jgi:hypothetical protein